MTKSEQREVAKLQKAYELGMDDMLARAMSALIRSAMTAKSRKELIAQAEQWELKFHPDFII
jgi:hypothetical protein